MSGKIGKFYPSFVHFGFGGGVSCCAIVRVAGEKSLAVGTTRGSCSLFSPITHMCTATVHEDSGQRSIVAIGQYSSDCLFLHIRAYAVLLITVECTEKVFNFHVTRTLCTDYYGFSGAITHKSSLFYPVVQDNLHLISIVTNNAEPTVRRGGASDKDSLMSFAVSDYGYVVCGLESGGIKVMDMENFSVLEERKLSPEPILSCAIFANKLAVSSVKSPIHLLDIDEKRITGGIRIPFPQKAAGCSTVSFSRCGKKLASGYWDGSVRVHSVRTGSLRVVLDFHSETINCLCWSRIEARRLLFVCSRDSKLSIWNLYND